MSDKGTEWRAARERLEDLDDWDRRGCAGTPLGPWFDTAVATVERVVEGHCRRCPILRECREYAVEWEPEGTLGGLSEKERRVLRRERAGSCLVSVASPAVLDGAAAVVAVGEAA